LPLFAFLLVGCAATIHATASPADATIYLTNEKPSPDRKPASYIAKATDGELNVRVKYYAWQEWYLWVGAEGYVPQVVHYPTEPKAGPIVGAVFLLFPAVWSIGPQSDATVEVELERGPRRSASKE
jgi:hypothetical protein